MSRIRFFVGAALVLGASFVSLRAGQTIQSGPSRVALIELYTSEGCSSCPPAEAWLNELRQDRGLWREFVPVAFHVNYWDRLGWRDVLASKAFTEREHAYAAAWNASSVYTPCFVRNGAEWRPRGTRPMMDTKTSDAGQLTLKWEAANRTCRVEFTPATPPTARRLDASIAMLGGGIVSDVRKGENAGRKLHHEFVALQLATVPLERDPATGAWTGTVTLPTRTDVKAERLALAGWIHAQGEQTPQQAAGGWLEERPPGGDVAKNLQN
jgi:hypothetical protein